MKIRLMCDGEEVAMVETSREPRIGTRFESGKPHEFFRVRSMPNNGQAEVEIITEEPLKELPRVHLGATLIILGGGHGIDSTATKKKIGF